MQPIWEATTKMLTNFPAFMEPEDLLPCWQQAYTSPFTKPDESSTHHTPPPPTYISVFLWLSKQSPVCILRIRAVMYEYYDIWT
jgi:hypothetical protein